MTTIQNLSQTRQARSWLLASMAAAGLAAAAMTWRLQAQSRLEAVTEQVQSRPVATAPDRVAVPPTPTPLPTATFVDNLPAEPNNLPVINELRRASLAHGAKVQSVDTSLHAATVQTLGHADLHIKVLAPNYLTAKAVLGKVLAADKNAVLQHLSLKQRLDAPVMEMEIHLSLLSRPVVAISGGGQ